MKRGEGKGREGFKAALGIILRGNIILFYDSMDCWILTCDGIKKYLCDHAAKLIQSSHGKRVE